jgi:hypothetical protein
VIPAAIKTDISATENKMMMNFFIETCFLKMSIRYSTPSNDSTI